MGEKLKKCIPAIAFTVVALAFIVVGAYYYYVYYGVPRCPACGMLITTEMMENFYVVDADTGQRLYACCPGCMLRLVAKWPNLRIEALDSWYGKAAPKIIIEIRNGTVISVTPESARLLLGAKITKSCSHNRIAINETSARLLLEKGYNPNNPVTVFKTQLPEGTPVVTVSAALPGLKDMGIAYTPPSLLLLIGIVIVGVAILAISIIAWKKATKLVAKSSS